MLNKIFNITLVFATVLVVAGCSSKSAFVAPPLQYSDRLPRADTQIEIENLSNCTSVDDTQLKFNSHQPVTIIVHGCFSSAGRFRALADVFAFQGQQAFCFNYDDRDDLDKSAAELKTALSQLAKHMQKPEIQVIGHSQGGLVARRALTDALESNMQAKIDLVTISAPYAGIQAAAHCGATWFTWLTLGLNKPICKWITGDKYRDIPPNSKFINQPGKLETTVASHLKINTDERNTCRRYNDKGDCAEDDYVFGLDEQYQPKIESDGRVASLDIKAGHAEIVGDHKQVPRKLLNVLQRHGVLNKTERQQVAAFEALLQELYLAD